MSPLLDSEKSIEKKVENAQPVAVESKYFIIYTINYSIIIVYIIVS